MAEVVAFSNRAKAQVPPPVLNSAPAPDMGDPNEAGNIYVSDSKGSRFVMQGSRAQAAEMNRNLAYGLEGGAWFVFHPLARASEHHG